MIREIIQIEKITKPVFCFVTRALNGYIIAIYRSQAIADKDSTDDVKQVTSVLKQEREREEIRNKFYVFYSD